MWKQFLVISDLHGLEYDEATIASACKWIQENSPERVVIAGDVWNFDAMRKGASRDERMVGISDDFACGKELIKRLQPTDVMLGNHDDRLYRMSESAGDAGVFVGMICQQAEDFIISQRADFYKYDVDTVCKLGPSLKVHHGLYFNMHAAKASAEYFGDVLCGHTHAIDYYRPRSLHSAEAWTIGCACGLRPSYAKNRPSTSRWRHAFAVGEYHTSKPWFKVDIVKEYPDGTFR